MRCTILLIAFFAVGAFSDGTANLSWDAPAARENGSDLPLDELAGYELVYRAPGSDIYTTIIIADGAATTKSLTLPVGDYEFMIAAYDVDGLFAEFSDPVLHTVAEDNSRPGASSLTITQGGPLGRLLSDVYDECTANPRCSVEFSFQVQ